LRLGFENEVLRQEAERANAAKTRFLAHPRVPGVPYAGEPKPEAPPAAASSLRKSTLDVSSDVPSDLDRIRVDMQGLEVGTGHLD
jgi:hypothetical protein